MATGEAIIIGELMATGQAEIQNVQTTSDGGIAALFAGHLASSLGLWLCLLAVLLA